MEDANKLLPETIIHLDGEPPVSIKCSYGVFLLFEEISGKDPFDVEQMKSLRPKDHIALIAAALINQNDKAEEEYRNDPAKYLKNLSRKVGLLHLDQIKNLIDKLFESASPEKKSETEKPASD